MRSMSGIRIWVVIPFVFSVISTVLHAAAEPKKIFCLLNSRNDFLIGASAISIFNTVFLRNHT